MLFPPYDVTYTVTDKRSGKVVGESEWFSEAKELVAGVLAEETKNALIAMLDELPLADLREIEACVRKRRRRWVMQHGRKEA